MRTRIRLNKKSKFIIELLAIYIFTWICIKSYGIYKNFSYVHYPLTDEDYLNESSPTEANNEYDKYIIEQN